MANYTAKDVKELRERTGIGMMDCKKALEETGGNLEESLKLLKEKGLKVAAKRADRATKEGLILSQVTGTTGYMIQVGCETDFVAKNDDFKNVAESLFEKFKTTGADFIGSDEQNSIITEASGKTGEKIQIVNSKILELDSGFITDYIHFNKKVGVLVGINAPATAVDNEKVKQFAKDVALQIAAMKPIALSADQVSDKQKAEQKDIFMKQLQESGKPAEIAEKIVTGKLNKYFSEMCLLDMVFVKDSKLKIKELMAQVSKETGFDLAIKEYTLMNFEE